MLEFNILSLNIIYTHKNKIGLSFLAGVEGWAGTKTTLAPYFPKIYLSAPHF